MRRGGGDVTGGHEWQDEVAGADVEAGFQRGRGDEGAKVAGCKALLGDEARRGREASVMREHDVGAQALRECEGDALRHAPQITKAPRPGNPVRRFQLPLLGSNQDSPDPEEPL